MRYFNLSLVFLAVVCLLTSCGSVATSTKDIKYMPIRFKPLTREDVTLVGNLSVEITVSGKLSKNGKTLDKAYSDNYKKGLVTKYEATEIMYFAPAPGETITGSLYDNEIFNTVVTPAGVKSNKKPGIFNKLSARLKSKVTASDPAVDFAYFALIEKYPNVDYFINVRFDRKVTVKGKKYTEVITAKADGLNLKTDPVKPDGKRN